MKILVTEEKRVTDNPTCDGCGYLVDDRLMKCNCWVCTLFSRCLKDSKEHCQECKEARTCKLIQVYS